MAAATTDLGRDIRCANSMSTGRFATRALLVGEACYRRLTTPRGMLRGGEEEANYGIDLSELVGSVNPKTSAAALPGRITSELEKDERVLSVEADVLVTTEGPETSFSVEIRVVTDDGPFTLKLLVTDVTVELLGIEAE